MKRFTLFLVLTALIVVPAMAERVSPETARKVATTFLNNNGAKSNQLVDLSKTAGFPNLYIFSTEESFVIMAADDCVEPILGYSLTGKFVAENMPENLTWWLQGYSDEIQYTIDHKANVSAEVAQQWRDLASGMSGAAKASPVVGPLIQTHWGQGYPYNAQCPGGKLTGCVATAMAQIMKYWGYPTTGFTSHSYTPTTHPDYGEQTVNFGATTYDWNHMIASYSDGYNNDQKDAVATLMYHCGVSVDMDYGSNGDQSSAITADVAYALTSYFNYSQTVQYIEMDDYVNQNGKTDLDQWTSIIKAELDAQPARPVQYKGRNSNSGHSFICDGYDTDGKFHFNWGWDEYSDGYYSITGILYPNNQAAIIGIQPIQSAAQAPTNLVSSVLRKNVSLEWTVGDNAVSYNIYRNHYLIGNTSANTFIDQSLPVGEYLYYVRGVDTEGNVTLPTNANIATVEFDYSLENVTLEHLEASYQDGNVSLQWEAPFRLNYIDYYTWNDIWYYTGTGSEKPFHWGARFLASMLDDGISLSSIATYFYTPGTYTARVYQCTGDIPSGTPIRNITSTYEKGWTVIPIDPFTIDASKDLWVVFSSTNIIAPTVVAHQSAENGNYYSLNGSNWYHFNPGGYAFFIMAGLTIGDFSYTLYDNGESIATDLSASACSLSSRSASSTHLYTIKATYNNEETPMSNMAGIAHGSASLSSLELGANDKLTITENCQLTVNETLVNSDPDNLILENGAQLIHNSANVHATVKKNISGYTSDEDGWYFIASPVLESFEPSKSNGFLNGTDEANTYDLYYYYEPTHLWKNYEDQAFNIEHKKGYLYANGETNGTTLKFTGTLMPSNTDVTISNLSYDATELKGFNLVGNPFACNAVVNKDYYIVNGNNVSIPETGHVIAPCESIFVQASENDASVTFTKAASAKGAGSKDCFDLVVTQGRANVDRARVRLNDGIGMEKFSLNDKNSQISLWQGGQDFAVAYTNGATEMPVSFLASKDGTYTLTLEAGNFDLDYLHLIDNLTGNDVDLLVTPSYTFEAKYSDYPSRFKLVFASVCEDADSDNENFAFINNGNIIIGQKGTLQIVDMTGRVIYQGDAKHCVSTSRMVSGVYVLRLITADDLKIQKIVVE